jgi:hypothetical protein
LYSAGLVVVAWLALLDTPGAGVPEAAAQPGASCRVIQLDMTPGAPDLQIVAWIEDREGNYVDTAFITRTTGSYGLGNRPGIMEFDSGPWWPYGRRLTTFPVWAWRHGMTWPLVGFQDGIDTQLSHSLNQSSRERFYCRPIKPDEPMWDATSCASTVYTDKGILSETEFSRYPPRADIEFDAGKDDPSVEGMAALNPFDSVSHATPRGESLYAVGWPVPAEIPPGDYVLWLEVSREFDFNSTYNAATFPSPEVPWTEYGEPYRGQPSVLYRVEFTLSDEARTEATTLDYAGYGDSQGVDGLIRPPDGTITTGEAGSGASRLLVSTDGDKTFRLRVSAFGSDDSVSPDAPGEVDVAGLEATRMVARFEAPGDDGLDGTVSGYEIRYLVGDEIGDDNFEEGVLVDYDGEVVPAGQEQVLELTGLLPRTRYSIGVRAYDECSNPGPVRTFRAVTPRGEAPAVDACFVATAAYGSLLAGQVSALRAFRDMVLRTQVAGEVAVEGYYTFGPLLARVIAPSETLRRAARAALDPIASELRAAGF